MEILSPCYVPSRSELRQFSPHQGQVMERTFTIGELTYNVVDFECHTGFKPAKLLHQFEKCHAVIFVADISQYDSPHPDSVGFSHLHQTLTEFDMVINYFHLSRLPVVLLLTGTQDLRKKLQFSSLASWFPDYTEGPDYGQACDYIRNRFISLNTNEERHFYTHFLGDEDTITARFVMAALNDIIIQEAIKSLDLGKPKATRSVSSS